MDKHENYLWYRFKIDPCIFEVLNLQSHNHLYMKKNNGAILLRVEQNNNTIGINTVKWQNIC